MTKYEWVFILSTFANVSHSSPAIRTNVEKSISFTLAWRNCNIVENQQQELRHLSELKENLKKCD